jgi:toxin ParE1/3/4
MSGYILSPRAIRDLDSIWDYTEETWGIEQAERYVRDVRTACEGLASGRKQGRPAEDVRPGYRKLAAGSHFLFYRTLPDGVIDIIRILHQSMDIPAHFAD